MRDVAWGALVGAVAWGVVAACAGAEVAQARGPEVGPGGAVAGPVGPVGPAAVPGVDEGLDCGAPAPPTGDFDYELGFAEAGAADALERAYGGATARLLDRHCGERVDCTELGSHVKRWRHGRAGAQVCAMVTVLKAKAREALAATASAEVLDVGLAERARALMAKMRTRKASGAVRAAVGAIADLGLAGGARAVWLAGRVERALAGAGFEVVEVARSGEGRARASGSYDVLVTGVIGERQEGRVEVFEVALRGRTGAATLLPVEPVVCGLDAVRRLGVASPGQLAGRRRVALRDAGVELEVETGRGGKLCEGDRTQIHLTVERAMHVRVFDLYAADGGLVIFPNEQTPTDLVPAGQAVALGGASAFDVFLAPGSSEERFVVVAAERAEDLGRWGGLAGTCRLGREDVRALVDGERGEFPGRALVAETGYRVVQEGCARPAPTEEQRARLLADLARVPSCR